MKIGTDVLFLIDSSQGVSPSDYLLQKEFVKKLAHHFKLSTVDPRGALAIYATDPYTVVNFGEQGFNRKVDRATLMRRPRRLDKALEHASDMFANSRRNNRKVLILLTAGNQAKFPDLKSLDKASEPLRRQGVHTYIIAIGRDLDTNVFRQIVDQTKDIYQVPAIGNIPSEAPEIARRIRDSSGKQRQLTSC